MKKIILEVEGMTCSACSTGLEKYLNKQNGIINASVNLVMANVSVDYDEKILNQEKIEKYIKQAGFKSGGIFKEVDIVKSKKHEKIEVLIFSILVVLMMFISLVNMFKIKIPLIFNLVSNPLIYTLLLFGFAILFLIYGFDILKNGYKNLIHKIPNMDTLVTLGVISSFIYSLYGMYKIIVGDYSYLENLYFESSVMVIYFVKLGRFLEGINKDKTKEAIKKLVEITPNQAVIEIDGKEKIITLDEIKKGNILISKPGEKIAVDGKIIEGKAHFDESFITGESKPVMKENGQNIIAGSFNYDGFIKYEAEKIGKESTISEIVRLVIEASNSKPKIAKTVDKISGFFVPIVLIIAFVTFLVYLLLGYDLSDAIEPFITILVVACPCSLGLATPLAIVVSEGVCINNGILVKKSEVLETASKIDTIVFDKTGTLTYGKLKISKMYNYSNLSDEKLLQIVGSIEAKSTHPIKEAFVDFMKNKKLNNLQVKEFKNISGYGVSGKIENQEYLLGSRSLVEKYNIPNSYIKDEEKLTALGNSIVYVIKNKKIIALIGTNDIIRTNAHQIIEELNKMNIQTIMLTGDNKKTAEIIGKKIEIRKIISNALPKEKVNIIKQLKEENKIVMMCGDGINDSPALANSDIGVSVKSGTDIAIDSSDVILIKNDLNSILKLINISEKTIKNIKQNLFWAFFYNVLMIPIAMGLLKPIGISINPMIASLAMVLSSLIVVANTLRLRKI